LRTIAELQLDRSLAAPLDRPSARLPAFDYPIRSPSRYGPATPPISSSARNGSLARRSRPSTEPDTAGQHPEW